MSTNTVTLKDIARALGVSSATVSIALNDGPGVNEETRRRVKEYAREVGYRPNVVARAMITGRSRLVAFVVARLTDSFYVSILQGVESISARLGYDILVYATAEQSGGEQRFIERLLDRRVDGVIGAAYALSDQALQQLQDADIPLVLLTPFPAADVSSISIDNHAGGRLAGEHLVQLGHRSILFLGSEGPYSSARFEGCSEVLRRVGGRMTRIEVGQGEDLESARRLVSEQLHSRDFTAVFASDDMTAAGALRSVREAGLRVPEDISVMGYDDLPWTEMTSPALTTVHQPQTRQGQAVMEAVISRIEGDPPRQVVLEPRLVVRESTGPAPRG
jgi:DNA-binding LacI/PurR family transcriptional regulator